MKHKERGGLGIQPEGMSPWRRQGIKGVDEGGGEALKTQSQRATEGHTTEKCCRENLGGEN